MSHTYSLRQNFLHLFFAKLLLGLILDRRFSLSTQSDEASMFKGGFPLGHANILAPKHYLNIDFVILDL